MPTTEPKLTTPGVIAQKLSVPLHRVLHVLKTRSHIRPAARAGRIRLYDRDVIEIVRLELNHIDNHQIQNESESINSSREIVSDE